MGIRSKKKCLPDQRGQAMVEFALVFLFIFFLFIAMMQFILLMYAYTTLADAAKDGVRYAVVHGTGTGVNLCSGPGTPPGSVSTVICNDSSGSNVLNGLGSQQWIGVLPLARLSFQNVSSVAVDYDPGSANTTLFGGPCSAPGCLVRVTVTHRYAPLFGLGWPTFTLNTAAGGRIMN